MDKMGSNGENCNPTYDLVGPLAIESSYQACGLVLFFQTVKITKRKNLRFQINFKSVCQTFNSKQRTNNSKRGRIQISRIIKLISI